MKHKLLIAFTLLIQGWKAQNDEVKLNQLMAPSSPAFNLLGISPEAIERPTNPTDFALSLNNASQSLSIIPTNYAMEVAPFWILNPKNMKWKDFVSNKFASNLQQSSLISIGTNTSTSKTDSSKISQLGIGFKVSLWRGNTTDDYVAWKDSADKVLGELSLLYLQIIDSIKTKDEVYLDLIRSSKDTTKSEEVQDKFYALAEKYKKETIEPKATKIQHKKVSANQNAYIKKLAENTNFVRIGWKLDLAGGFVIDFPKNNFDNGKTSKAAVWLTGGYDNPKKISVLGTIKVSSDYFTAMLNDSGKVVRFNTNIINADAGLKFIYNFSEKCYFSGEALIRNPIIQDQKQFDDNFISYQKKTERWTLSLNYNVANNQNVCFTFGKNFANLQDNKNNLLAFLTYAIGIGSSRPTN